MKEFPLDLAPTRPSCNNKPTIVYRSWVLNCESFRARAHGFFFRRVGRLLFSVCNLSSRSYSMVNAGLIRLAYSYKKSPRVITNSGALSTLCPPSLAEPAQNGGIPQESTFPVFITICVLSQNQLSCSNQHSKLLMIHRFSSVMMPM